MNVGFLGFGRMGSALAAGAIASKALKASQVFVYDPDTAARRSARVLRVRTRPSVKDVVSHSDLVFLCVKPQRMSDLLAELKGSRASKLSSPHAVGGDPALRPRVDSRQRHSGMTNKCFVSIAAGVPIRKLEAQLGRHVPVIRVMPNTPALIRLGVSAVSRGRHASAKQEAIVGKILAAVGEVVSVPEKWMDAVTALSGSGPAYVFYLVEALVSGAVKCGLPRKTAERLARRTVTGAGGLLNARVESAEELRRQVTSPGGTTAAAIQVFESKGFKKLVETAIRAAAKRSWQLSKQ